MTASKDIDLFKELQEANCRDENLGLRAWLMEYRQFKMNERIFQVKINLLRTWVT